MKTLIFHIKQSLGLLALVLLVMSCSTTKVISEWSLEPPPSGVMRKTLVLGVMPDRETREKIEQAMAGELNKSGLEANTATSIFGPRGLQGLTEEQVTSKLRGSAYTSVMIVSLQDKEVDKNYSPGMYYTTPRVVGYSRYYRRYLVVYDRMYTPGYYTTSTKYVLGADIYTVNDDDQLVYSAQTRSYDPASAKALAESFSKSIITGLRSKGIVPK